MNLVPQKELKQAVRWMDDFFNGEPSLFPLRSAKWVNQAGAVELSEDKDHVYAQIEVPGIEKKDISIQFNNGLLTIEAQREEKHESKEKTTTYSEFSYGKIQRTLNVGNINLDKSVATYQDGILKVTLPKVDAERAKSICVN